MTKEISFLILIKCVIKIILNSRIKRKTVIELDYVPYRKKLKPVEH